MKILLILFVLIFTGCNLKANVLSLPISVPFDLSKAGSVYETEFEIKKSLNWFAILTLYDTKEWHKVHWHTFDISFLSNRGQETDYNNLKEIIGGSGRYIDGRKNIYGIPMLLKITITPLEGNIKKIQYLNGYWLHETLNLQTITNKNIVYVVDLSDRPILSSGTSENKLYSTRNKRMLELLAEEGIYKVRIENLQNVPQMIGRKSNIEIHEAYNGK